MAKGIFEPVHKEDTAKIKADAAKAKADLEKLTDVVSKMKEELEHEKMLSGELSGQLTDPDYLTFLSDKDKKGGKRDVADVTVSASKVESNTDWDRLLEEGRGNDLAQKLAREVEERLVASFTGVMNTVFAKVGDRFDEIDKKVLGLVGDFDLRDTVDKHDDLKAALGGSDDHKALATHVKSIRKEHPDWTYEVCYTQALGKLSQEKHTADAVKEAESKKRKEADAGTQHRPDDGAHSEGKKTRMTKSDAFDDAARQIEQQFGNVLED